MNIHTVQLMQQKIEETGVKDIDIPVLRMITFDIIVDF